jgi:ABC-type uncharacterized transport system involved in gliding motility auxiliary subunit
MEMKKIKLRYKKLLTGLNVFALCLIVIAVWGMINYLTNRHYRWLDLTFDKKFSITDKTRKEISKLEADLKITTLFNPGQDLQDLEFFDKVKNLLSVYQYHSSNKIKIIHLDVYRNRDDVEFIVQEKKLDTIGLKGSVLFEYKDRYKLVSRNKIERRSFSGSPFSPQRSVVFVGEEAFTSAIVSLRRSKQPKIYFSKGHGERDIRSHRETGLSRIAEALKNEENMIVEEINLIASRGVPKDALALVIAGPRKKFSEVEKEYLKKYLKNKGRIFCLLDPMTSTGLEEWLKDWGVEVGSNVIIEMDPKRVLVALGFSQLTFMVTEYPFHPIIKGMQDIGAIFSMVRSVEPLTRGDIKSETILDSSDKAWAETDFREKRAVFNEDKDRKGPIPFGVAIESSPIGSDKDNVWKMVVVGDSDFAVNSLGPVVGQGNKDLFINIIKWLAEEEDSIAISAKPQTDRKVLLTSSHNTTILLSLLGVFIFIAIAGCLVIFVVRRN